MATAWATQVRVENGGNNRVQEATYDEVTCWSYWLWMWTCRKGRTRLRPELRDGVVSGVEATGSGAASNGAGGGASAACGGEATTGGGSGG